MCNSEVPNRLINESSPYLLQHAQDADSEGVEGKYYLLSPGEVTGVLGNTDGELFNRYYDITSEGNFEEKNIPNLLKQRSPFENMTHLTAKLYDYRKTRTTLHKDQKLLTAWNSLMIWAFADGYRITGDETYLRTAKKAAGFIDHRLSDGITLYVSMTNNKRGQKGFLDEYAFYILALIALYEACLDDQYLHRALELNQKVLEDFYDYDHGGFYLSGKDNEQLILQTKESYDGAIPSGNSVMAYNLVRLSKLTKDTELYDISNKHQKFMKTQASGYPNQPIILNIGWLDNNAVYLAPYNSIYMVINSDKHQCYRCH